jgi:nitrogen fixation/metabolism regulation signal transduction histidine kinase
VVGGRKLNTALLQSLATPAGMRILIYSSPEGGSGGFLSSNSESFEADKLLPLAQNTLLQNSPASATVQWRNGGEEVFHALPLRGFADKPAAVLLVGNSLAAEQHLEERIERVSLLIAMCGMAFGLILSGIIAAHITRPVKDLAVAASEIGRGNWDVKVKPGPRDEIGQLADAFNQMTHELIAQKERLVQSERVAAWRELARRLAHELKNPLFPLQLTVENLLRAREAGPEQFEEVFRESTTTLLAEIANLKTIIGRFSDFSKMPAPQLQPVDLNEMVRSVAQLFQGQFQRDPGKIEPLLQLDSVPPVSADPVLLRRVVENLVLNAIDAMPKGGTLTFRTSTRDKYAVLELSDTGVGLTPEECERVFTTYYTSKQHGTGLGLAIVQSVISDHKGTITVSSRKNEGTTFHVELPIAESAGAERTQI